MIPIKKLIPGLTALLVTLAVPGIGNAAITPGSLFTDNAVLQQKIPVPVWGTADPNEPIVVTINGQTAKTTADDKGAWTVKLKPIPAGGPYTLTITGTPADTVTLNNILVGEVWICGGQSNMQYPVKGFIPGSLTTDAIAKATDPMIHFVNVSNTIGITPQTSVKGNWQEANPNTVGNLSAVGYFFGRDLRKALGVPIGLIHDNWGGTPAEAWTSKEALDAVPDLKHYVDEEASYTTRYPKMVEDFDARMVTYNADKAKFDAAVADAKTNGTPVPTNAPRKPNMPNAYERWPSGAGHLYNGMIAPIAGYGIKGTIWYQGEANGGRGWEYKTLLATMITDWRKKWGQGDFPFLFVQLAPFMSLTPTPLPRNANGWPDLREAQRQVSLTLPNTGMAVITDQGDIRDIHPQRKEPVGVRLALIARATVYGEKGIEYSGPMFDSLKVEGSTARVKFTHATGMKAIEIHDVKDDGPLIASAEKVLGFEVAGADQVYYAADAKIDGTSILVSNPNVTIPVAVRYGWANYPVANLSNGAGLPATPFKSDNWSWASGPKDPAPAAAK
ncbi:MAG TPA: sialate O-acetylesterase [Capsulimonadaceae bacterium]